jgi:hypothetical protein
MTKSEQAMRTHPDIGLVIADFLQLARFWLCTAYVTFRKRNLVSVSIISTIYLMT